MGALLAFACAVACDSQESQGPSRGDRTNEKLALTVLKKLRGAITVYRVEHRGSPPKNLEALARDRYLEEIPRDPWGRPYVYTSGVDVRSAGIDGEPHTDDDVVVSLKD